MSFRVLRHPGAALDPRAADVVPVRKGGYGRQTFFLAYGEQEAVLNIEDPRYAKALRHPLRARILAALLEREATPTELAGLLDASVGTVAYHVRTLNALGLIELTGETRVRGAVAHHYRAVADPKDESANGGSALAGPPGATLSALDPEICRAIGSFEDDEALATRVSVCLDTAGWHQLADACGQLLKQADRIARSSAERLAQDPQESARAAGMVLFMFEARQEKGDTVS